MEIRQFMDCVLPMPVVGKLEDNCQGAKGVIPRDWDNDLEEDKGNDGHASKVIVIPFDGEDLNRFAGKQYYGKQTDV